jgi:hypothetical protein
VLRSARNTSFELATEEEWFVPRIVQKIPLEGAPGSGDCRAMIKTQQASQALATVPARRRSFGSNIRISLSERIAQQRHSS